MKKTGISDVLLEEWLPEALEADRTIHGTPEKPLNLVTEW
jgi:hypothetical protein